jgi:3-oxoacyl-[acyl-carrier protein] reductase
MGESERFCSSKQLHLQEVTVDSRYENYSTAVAQKRLAFVMFFDDKSDTHGLSWRCHNRIGYSIMESLSGKLALVTGGSRGIGAAVALALAGAGADVVANFRARSEDAAKVCAEIRKLGRRALAIQADVSQSDQVQKMVAQIEREVGAVNILVNNAGMARQLKLEDIAEADWDEHISVNLKSAFLVTQAVLPQMRAQRWGRIINISSVAAQTGGLVGPHYAASKAGMLGLTRSYAALLAQEGVTANTVCPALVDTEMMRANPRATSSVIPIGRFGTVDEVASVVLMLAENAYLTGQTVNPNGGWYFI